jgi:hypothetical protein
MLLKFLVDGYYNGQHKYKKGLTYEIDNTLGEANRWLKRGAIEVPFETIVAKEEIELGPEVITLPEEVVVKRDTKKENGRGNKRNKGIPLNETSEIL